MERKLKPIPVQEALRARGLRLFSPEEFRRAFDVTLRAAQGFLHDHRADLFVKLRNGLYALRTDFPDSLEIANRLYAPSYVSFEYALSLHRLIPETVYAVTSATPRLTREFTAGGRTFEYARIQRAAYGGYRPEQRNGVTVLIAEPEKALVDYLYFVDLGLKPMNDRLRTAGLRKGLAVRYASGFRRKSLTARLREIL